MHKFIRRSDHPAIGPSPRPSDESSEPAAAERAGTVSMPAVTDARRGPQPLVEHGETAVVSRRDLLNIAVGALIPASAAATPAIAVAPLPQKRQDSDAELLELGRQFDKMAADFDVQQQRLLDLEEALCKRWRAHNDVSAGKGWSDDPAYGEAYWAVYHFGDELRELENKVVATPATTLEGMRVKARVIKRQLGHCPADGELAERAGASLTADLLRGAGPTA